MRSTSVTLALAGAALIAGSASATPAFAAPSQLEDRSMLVSYADLDLGSADGVAELDRRVRTAARRMCSDPSDRSLEAAARKQDCLRMALQRSAVQVASVTRQSRLGG